MAKTYFRLALALIVIPACCAGVVRGQTNALLSQDSQTTKAALREKAFDLIESVAGQIGTLQSAENRARLGVNIADALWQRDEKRARTLFISSEEDIRIGLQSAEGDERTRVRTRRVFLQLRINTVERIAKHDPELALSFLKATELSEDVPRNDDLDNFERNLTLNLAQQVAANSPELALKLGRESLAAGFDSESIALLKKLNSKHREQAMTLYGEIVGKLKTADLLRESVALYFALDLSRSFRPPAADDASFRELINLFMANALTHGCADKKSEQSENAWFCSTIGSLVSEIEKVDPRGAARLKQWAPEESNDAGSPEPSEEMNNIGETGTVDELLTLATKYPLWRDDLYGRAFGKATASGDVALARKIATDYVSDLEMKHRMLAQLDRDQIWTTMSDEKMAQLQKELDALPGTPERVDLLVRVAGRFGGSDRKTALKLLDQANTLTDTMKPGQAQSEAQMMLATAYCSEKSDRGLAIIESLIPKLNELVTAVAKLDGYDHNNLREGEWNMSSQGSVGGLLTGLAQSAGYFAWCDFERAVTLTGQFERPEIRLMAQLKLAQGILAGPPPRIRKDPAVVY